MSVCVGVGECMCACVSGLTVEVLPRKRKVERKGLTHSYLAKFLKPHSNVRLVKCYYIMIN